MHVAAKMQQLVFALSILLSLTPSIGHSELFSLESFTLENGLQVVVIPNHRASVVVQMILYRAGSADEPEGVSGVAHFLEHLMFKGTEQYPEDRFSKNTFPITVKI